MAGSKQSDYNQRAGARRAYRISPRSACFLKYEQSRSRFFIVGLLAPVRAGPHPLQGREIAWCSPSRMDHSWISVEAKSRAINCSAPSTPRRLAPELDANGARHYANRV
mmetsp:Transcript_2636/g.8228  ORF Transcript_2636/g.8228 Transcript_2636/m.8228 type:complete len:109 (+) Transcript_2636:292-618(+)